MMFTQRKRWIIASIAILLGTGSIAPEALAHPGRTDKYGGHTCRTNCEKWGLEYGEYHYHNGSSRSSRASSSKPAGSNAGSTKSKSSSTGGRATSKSKSKPAPAKKQPQTVEAGITVSWNKEAVSMSSKPVRYQDQLMLPPIPSRTKPFISKRMNNRLSSRLSITRRTFKSAAKR